MYCGSEQNDIEAAFYEHGRFLRAEKSLKSSYAARDGELCE